MQRGIYCVAFGLPARLCATRLIETIRQFLPDIPVAVSSGEPLGVEDIFIAQPDSDAGARRAKLHAYDVTPAEWDAVLYLDVDTEIISHDAMLYFTLISDGWEFVICKDPYRRDTLHSFRRPNNLAELTETADELLTMHTLQFNGGVWSFGRSDRMRDFFKRWLSEWERHGQRDQGALVRAMYADPMRVYVLGNEWNYFDRYSPDSRPVGIKHYPGRARRWEGMLPGRIDAPSAWARVKQFEKKRGTR